MVEGGDKGNIFAEIIRINKIMSKRLNMKVNLTKPQLMDDQSSDEEDDDSLDGRGMTKKEMN